MHRNTVDMQHTFSSALATIESHTIYSTHRTFTSHVHVTTELRAAEIDDV